jgi:hypothetical protein
MDPYRILEVSPTASEDELRAAYHRAVQRHHPDHNGGSAESARRFEAVQEAWAETRRLRDGAHGTRKGDGPPADPSVESRLAAMERELREVREAGERAAREAAAARAAARSAASAAADAARSERPSDEELGYIRTDDSFGKILSDAREELLGNLQEKPVSERAADLLDDVAAALRGGRPKRSN